MVESINASTTNLNAITNITTIKEQQVQEAASQTADDITTTSDTDTDTEISSILLAAMETSEDGDTVEISQQAADRLQAMTSAQETAAASESSVTLTASASAAASSETAETASSESSATASADSAASAQTKAAPPPSGGAGGGAQTVSVDNSEDDSETVYDLSRYSDYQLKQLLADGTITRNQYNEETENRG